VQVRLESIASATVPKDIILMLCWRLRRLASVIGARPWRRLRRR